MGREAAEKLWNNLRALGARRLAVLAFAGWPYSSFSGLVRTT